PSIGKLCTGPTHIPAARICPLVSQTPKVGVPSRLGKTRLCRLSGSLISGVFLQIPSKSPVIPQIPPKHISESGLESEHLSSQGRYVITLPCRSKSALALSLPSLSLVVRFAETALRFAETSQQTLRQFSLLPTTCISF